VQNIASLALAVLVIIVNQAAEARLLGPEEQPVENNKEPVPQEEKAEPETTAKPSEKYPWAEVERPLSLPHMMLELRVGHTSDIIENSTNTSFHFGGGLGVLDVLEFGLDVPLALSSKIRVGDLRLYGQYQLGSFMDNNLHTASRIQMIIPLSAFSYWEYSDFVMLLGLPTKWKLNRMFALLVDFDLGFSLAEQDLLLLLFDLDLLFQPIVPLSFWIGSGLHGIVGDERRLVFPLKFGMQYVLVEYLDVFALLDWSQLRDSGTSWVQVMVGLDYRFH